MSAQARGRFDITVIAYGIDPETIVEAMPVLIFQAFHNSQVIVTATRVEEETTP